MGIHVDHHAAPGGSRHAIRGGQAISFQGSRVLRASGGPVRFDDLRRRLDGITRNETITARTEFDERQEAAPHPYEPRPAGTAGMGRAVSMRTVRAAKRW
ncbi:hypothetical protein [Nocardia thraciensis]